MLNKQLPQSAPAMALLSLVLALSACSTVHDGASASAVSPRRLAADLPAALPPPTALSAAAAPPSASAVPDLASHADVGARIGPPPSPREAMASVAPVGPPAETPAAAPAPAAPPVAMARAAEPAGTPLAEPLPGGEVGAGIRAGQCWAQLVMEPRTTRRTVQVVTEDGVTRLVVQPPRLRTETRELVVKEAAQTYRVEPPRFRQVVERVLVKEEVRRLVVVPAVYENREEQVQIESARVVLESCRASAQRAAGSSLVSRQAKCAREIPPRYQTLTRRVLVQPEITREEVAPAQYAAITKWVLDTPARTVPETLPATTKALPVTEVASPAQVREQAVAPATTSVQVAQHEGMPQLVWRRALCESEAQPGVVSAVQTALRGRGLDVGAVDGKLGRKTMSALMAFQRQEGLAIGLLTHETLGQLGLDKPPVAR